MTYQITKELPSLKEVLTLILSSCFPGKDYSPREYMKASEKFPVNWNMEWDDFDESTLGRLCYSLNNWDPVPIKKIVKKKSEGFDEPKFDLKGSFFVTAKSEDESLRVGLAPFFDLENKSVIKWLNGSPKSVQDSTLYRGASFYTLGLLSFADCDSFIRFFYERLGIDENTQELIDCASILNWKEDFILFQTYILLGCSNGNAWTESKLALLEAFINEKMKPVRQAILAEKAWVADVSDFRPRSVEDTKIGLSMQDFFVATDFTSQNVICEEPMAKLAKADSGIKQLIVGRTGMGKSMYIRMAMLSMCRNLLECEDKIAVLAEKMPAPTDKYVIYIPAYMFSYCYSKEEYKAWTEDLIALYFQCMFRLSEVINFDKRKFRDERQNLGLTNCEISELLIGYIKALAQSGRLVLVADSFDEIVFGDMRTAYLSALRKFKNQYCNCPEGVGAYVIVTSREMSQSTMEDLASSIGIKLKSNNVSKIEPLSVKKQEQLIMNWDKYFRNDIKDNLRQLSNHFFTDMGSNPYMLSIICCYSGAKMNNILDKLIPAILMYRIGQAKDTLESELLRSTLEAKQVMSIMQDLAFDTVQLGNAHFSLDLLAKQCQIRFADMELSKEEFDYCHNIIVSLFTTAVGLIVPADNEDDCFQFISEPIRFELASSKLSGELMKCGSNQVAIQRCVSFVSNLIDDKDYVDMIVPLICKTKQALISETLIKDLVLRSYNKENEWQINRALVDIILCRYGMNITGLAINKRSPESQYCLNADRLVVMRLLSAPNFSPSELEKKSILESNAFKASDGFINSNQKNSLL